MEEGIPLQHRRYPGGQFPLDLDVIVDGDLHPTALMILMMTQGQGQPQINQGDVADYAVVTGAPVIPFVGGVTAGADVIVSIQIERIKRQLIHHPLSLTAHPPGVQGHHYTGGQGHHLTGGQGHHLTGGQGHHLTEGQGHHFTEGQGHQLLGRQEYHIDIQDHIV